MPRRLISEHFRSDGKPKMVFESQDAADAYLRRTLNDTLESYQCGFCKKYHVGKKIPH